MSGPDAGKVFPLTTARTILGRAEDATIQLAHPSVSRQHAEVAVLHDGRLELIDSGSSNGLVLNGKTIRREILEGGDLFELGDVRVRVLEPGAAVPTSALAESSSDAEKPRAWLPAVVFVAVVVIGGAAAWIARQPHALPSGGTVGTSTNDAPAAATEPSPADPAPVEAKVEEPSPPVLAPLAEAIALCKHQECDRARELVDAKVPANDPSLVSADAKVFFHAWAVDVIARAKVETDIELRKPSAASFASDTVASSSAFGSRFSRCPRTASAPSVRSMRCPRRRASPSRGPSPRSPRAPSARNHRRPHRPRGSRTPTKCARG